MNGRAWLRAATVLLLPAAAAFSLGNPACSSSCATIACIPSVSIAFERPLSAEGTYELSLQVDDSPVTCTATIPSNSAPTCTDERAFVLQSRDGALSGFSVDGTIQSIGVMLTLDEKTIGQASFAPKYEALPIGGVGCGTCPLAQDILPISLGPDGGVDAGSVHGQGERDASED